ncbi:cytochrome C biosynthesis protein [Synechococcus sp. KORDI-52]|uniref:GAP family protein n=1 Tax=Synechococcus sp. KORDI-52 TaxID=585425 RepID=UPI0004E036EC|nr:GAP family protein [Synechococcus sp. KORDI-52]AII48824.1 cytochrome C biosynthesis protein [Synechococcus sp. KORDI-52]
MAEPRIWTELLTYGLGIALSPIHLVLLLLLLLGASPLRRGGLFVGGWLLTSALVVIALLTLGHGLLLDMSQGSDHRTGLDLIGGGALIALGGRELIRGVLNGGEAPAWSGAVDRFAAMPLPLLLLISSVTEVISPDDILLFAKSAAVILAAQLPLQAEIAWSAGFSAATSVLLLIPFLAVLIGRQRVLPLLQSGKIALLRRGELVVGSLSVGLGSYLGWQGISGLMIN